MKQLLGFKTAAGAAIYAFIAFISAMVGYWHIAVGFGAAIVILRLWFAEDRVSYTSLPLWLKVGRGIAVGVGIAFIFFEATYAIGLAGFAAYWLLVSLSAEGDDRVKGLIATAFIGVVSVGTAFHGFEGDLTGQAFYALATIMGFYVLALVTLVRGSGLRCVAMTLLYLLVLPVLVIVAPQASVVVVTGIWTGWYATEWYRKER